MYIHIHFIRIGFFYNKKNPVRDVNQFINTSLSCTFFSLTLYSHYIVLENKRYVCTMYK